MFVHKSKPSDSGPTHKTFLRLLNRFLPLQWKKANIRYHHLAFPIFTLKHSHEADEAAVRLLWDFINCNITLRKTTQHLSGYLQKTEVDRGPVFQNFWHDCTLHHKLNVSTESSKPTVIPGLHACHLYKHQKRSDFKRKVNIEYFAPPQEKYLGEILHRRHRRGCKRHIEEFGSHISNMVRLHQ